MEYTEEIDDRAIAYIKEVKKMGGELNYGLKKHEYLIHTTQTLVDGYYNNEPNEWHEGRAIAWELQLMENIQVGEGSYFRVKLSDKALNILDKINGIPDTIKIMNTPLGIKIDGVQVTYGTREIRTEIEDMLEVNESFNLPKKYTYEITPSNFWGKVAKIILK